MPFPQILQMITRAMATMAISQSPEQLSMADWDSVRPMAMIIGPVTMGGKKRITLPVPKILIRRESSRYTSPAHATPKQAYGRRARFPPAASIGAMAAYPPRKAKEEPRNAGTLPFVSKWNNSVPRPANSRVVDTSRPVSIGTSMVAPNMANICCTPSTKTLGTPRLFAS